MVKFVHYSISIALQYNTNNHFCTLPKCAYICVRYILILSRDNAVGISTNYWLTTEGPEFESKWGQEFSLLHVVQAGSEVHPTSYPMGIGGSSPGVKRPGREVDHSPPTSAEV
jgi:hypothetical protein